MCEFADNSAVNLLAAHYTITGSLCEYQRFLADFCYPDVTSNGIDISILDSDDHDAFIKASIQGFSSTGRPT
ncbi:unnamed protein product [Aureobasidium uvarum]|uniref:Uncharacterized protein n=1 Tax=Aureobasidium uvarum TaxID=2773716 RepID=A0A9N8KAK2_9PEZI|nr:unnamed protein product [Aureobasidium uvarum]